MHKKAINRQICVIHDTFEDAAKPADSDEELELDRKRKELEKEKLKEQERLAAERASMVLMKYRPFKPILRELVEPERKRSWFQRRWTEK